MCCNCAASGSKWRCNIRRWTALNKPKKRFSSKWSEILNFSKQSVHLCNSSITCGEANKLTNCIKQIHLGDSIPLAIMSNKEILLSSRCRLKSWNRGSHCLTTCFVKAINQSQPIKSPLSYFQLLRRSHPACESTANWKIKNIYVTRVHPNRWFTLVVLYHNASLIQLNGIELIHQVAVSWLSLLISNQQGNYFFLPKDQYSDKFWQK